ncbi:hypothetical protein V3G71_00030 [Microbacterium paraoxydans]|uniref:hypothetical protein n=1 Tax=Microbacterium paraoxydans TaxID=199592 RepID=UPI002F260D66
MRDRNARFDDGEVRHHYDDSEVRCNFDLRKLLGEHRASRRPAGRGSTAAQRKLELRRLVGREGMPLEEAEELDFDTFADDMAVLEKLRRRYLMKPQNAPRVGAGGVYRIGSLLFEGPSRAGKDVLAHEVAQQLVDLAALTDRVWRVVKPGGRNALEDVGRAEIAHHEDVRYEFAPTFDEALRYLDPNEAVIAATRFSNSPPIAPRAILMTTSETAASLALTMKARKTAEDLAKSADDFAAVNVDEFLFRLGWLVKIRNRDDLALNDLAGVRSEMVASIFKVHRQAESRIDVVINRDGDACLGSIRTRHQFEMVAEVKGCERAARFIAMSVIEEFSPDVASDIGTEIQAFAQERVEIERASNHEYEARMLALAAHTCGRVAAEHFRSTHLDGVSTPDPSGQIFTLTNGDLECGMCLAATAKRVTR